MERSSKHCRLKAANTHITIGTVTTVNELHLLTKKTGYSWKLWKKTVGEHDFIYKVPCRLIHFTSLLEIICTDMSRSLQNLHYSAFTSVFCSELQDLTLSLLQVVSQSLVLIQDSDHSDDNNNNNVTEQPVQTSQTWVCGSKCDLLYFCSHDCSDVFIWTWLKLSSHCRLFTSCKRSRLAYLISFTASIHMHIVL